MNANTFSEAYCRQHKLPPEDFERAVLAAALYPHARLLAPLIRSAWPNHFVADLDLIRSAGRLRRLRDFSVEVTEFLYHPANIGSLRQVFRLRVSTQRLRQLVQKTLHDPANAKHPPTEGTGTPFVPPPAESGRAG